MLDSSKHYLGVRDLYEAATQWMKIIFITRSVDGSVWSSLRHDTGSVRKAALSWRKSNLRALRMLAGIPSGDYKHVPYGELCHGAVRTWERLC